MRGFYVLVVRVFRASVVRVGALGRVCFSRGRYLYVGSAMNSVEARLARHFWRGKRKRWHIDYLLENDSVLVGAAFVKASRQSGECVTARRIVLGSLFRLLLTFQRYCLLRRVDSFTLLQAT